MLSRSRKAFTLIELIVVIVILGLLAALAIPTFSTVINNSKVATAEASAESIGRNAVALSAFELGEDGVEDFSLSLVAEAATEAGGATARATSATEAVVNTNGYNVTIELVDGSSSVAVKGEPVKGTALPTP